MKIPFLSLKILYTFKDLEYVSLQEKLRDAHVHLYNIFVDKYIYNLNYGPQNISHKGCVNAVNGTHVNGK